MMGIEILDASKTVAEIVDVVLNKRKVKAHTYR